MNKALYITIVFLLLLSACGTKAGDDRDGAGRTPSEDTNIQPSTGAEVPDILPPEKLRFMLWDIDGEKPGAKAWFYVGGTYDYNVIYWKEEYEPARDNWPINVVGRVAGRFEANDSFEVKHFFFRDNRFSAKVNVFRTESKRIQSQKIAYFGFYLPNVKLNAGDYPLKLNFDIYAKPETAPDKSRFAESFTEEYTFKVLKGKLCGSQMSVTEAVKEADLIVHAKAVVSYAFIIEEIGSASGGGKFEVISVLKGKWNKKEMQVSYECTYITVRERAVRKGEEVILFIKHRKTAPTQQAMKIVFATDEVRDNIKALLDSNSGKSGKGVKEDEGE